MKLLSIFVGVVVIIAGVWYFLMTRPITPVANLEPKILTEENVAVSVTKPDISASSVSKLPAGFPTSIPVETANITESYRAVYNERGVTQYTVSYTSLKTRDALWDAYSSYMKGAGYTLDTGTTSKTSGNISGTNASNDTLSVILSSRSGTTLVQMSLLDRQ